MAKKRKYTTQERREPYLKVFLTGFFVMLLVMLPVMIYTKGYFIYYGDFNSQQLPFYWLAHDAVQNGNFGWNWQTDLGANFIGSYSFYLLGSPFFWLTVPFPQEWTLYLMPYLLALKHAFAALTAYAYIRRFVRSRKAAMAGGLIYAFSGFQMFNIFFNHFQDVTAFFPLLLIAMEQRINENRRGIFAVTVAFMAILNYYFFTGQAVFAVIYFICRCTCKDFHANLRKFGSVALEAVIGVMMACFMLLPSALAIIDNYRVKTLLYGNDLVAYSEPTRVLRIIQSFFMIPDAPARPNLFQSDYGKWASIGGYLPMFSMAGVIAFMTQKRRHWATKLTAVCIVCALIPVLNSMFYMFNGSYYARWFYMPILIMSMMTVQALDDRRIQWKGGVTVCGLVFLGLALISILPRKNKDGEPYWFDFAKYTWYFWITLALTLVLFYFALLTLNLRKTGKPFYGMAVYGTVLSCLCATFTLVYFGIGLGVSPTAYLNTAIRGGSKISLEGEENQFYRIDISDDHDNFPMFWGYSNMRCFHSIVPTSTMDFYDAINVQRDVASRPEKKEYPIRSLFSVKYYFDRVNSDEADEYDYQLEDMPGFTYLKKENGFYIYENEAYLPMGIAYSHYVDADELQDSTALMREKTMLKALALTQEQIAQYGNILTKLPDAEKYGMDDDAFVAYCKDRRADTCDTFTYDSYGFEAAITLEQPQLVFFSVPYESGWTAEVNGEAVPVEKVNYGFMAVACPSGENTITFHYETPGLRTGAVTSLCGLAALLLYLLWAACSTGGKRAAYSAHKYEYDYAPSEPMPEHAMYLAHAAAKHLQGAADQPEEESGDG